MTSQPLPKNTPEIKFYAKDDPYGWMSNFYRAEIFIRGEWYATSEHYYQSSKAVYPDDREWIRAAPTPHKAFKATRALKPEEIWPYWDEVKLDIMREAIWAKFTQHPNLRKMLMETGEAILIENSPVDSFWGCGKDGKGENWLGKLLMELRHDFCFIPQYCEAVQ